MQLEENAHGAARQEGTASQKLEVGGPASLPDSLMYEMGSDVKSPKLGPRKILCQSQLLKDAFPLPFSVLLNEHKHQLCLYLRIAVRSHNKYIDR
jgi:hypothetical protein